MSDLNIRVTVSFSSDWHIGSGSGVPGSLDSVVRRDPSSNLPYVPAKTLTGILRNACEPIASGLDGGTPGGWTGAVAILFGDQPARDAIGDVPPVRARLSLRPAVFPERIAAHLTRDPELRAALTFVKPGVEICRETGAAREKFLRMEEMVRGGCELEANGTIDCSGLKSDAQNALLALLWAGSTTVRRIGAKRRRGGGRCTFSVSVVSQGGVAAVAAQTMLTRLKEQAPKAKRFPHAGSKPGPAGLIAAPDNDRWHRILLRLVLESPVVVSAGILGNVVRSLDYIPGTQLLGPVAKLLAGGLDLRWHDAIACGDLQVINAYTEVGGVRGLPVPVSFVCEKGTEGLEKNEPDRPAVANLLAGEGLHGAFRPHRSGYIASDGEFLPPFVSVSLSSTTHNTINDERQQPITEEGGVFSYEAIRAGTVLRTEIRCRETIWKALKTAKWREAIEGRVVTIGIARKDDYGRVRLSVVSDTDAPPAETGSTSGAVPSLVTIYLASDLLIRGNSLRPSADPQDMAGAIAGALGAILPDVRVTPGNAHTRIRRTDGWHTGWQLPRPTYAGLRAGSVLQFSVWTAGPADLDAALVALGSSGLGERRAEGFGELRINEPILTEPLMTKHRRPAVESGTTGPVASAAPMPAVVKAGDSSFEFCRLVEEMAWRKRIQRAALTWASDPARRTGELGWGGSPPGNAQLGALRSLMRAFVASDRELVLAWIERAGDGGSGAKNLRKLLSDHEHVWRHLTPSGLPAMTDRADVDLKTKLWANSVRALLLASIQAEQREREHDAQRPPTARQGSES